MIDMRQYSESERDQIRRFISQSGEWVTSYSSYFSKLREIIAQLKETDSDIVWLATAIYSVHFFSTKDPTPAHFIVAKELLEKKNESDPRAIDLLAKELVVFCQKLQAHLVQLFSDRENSLAALPFWTKEGFFLPSRDY